MAERAAHRPALVAAGLGGLAAALALANLSAVAPTTDWFAAAFAPDGNDMRELVVHYSLLPRLAVALLCGIGLGLSGALMQQVLRNPLAEPGTLGVFAGARLALVAATLWAPGLLAYGYEPVALAGGASCMAVVLALARGRGFAPVAVVLSGMIVSLALEAANKMLTIGNYETLSDLLIWQAGSLAQNSWETAAGLAPRIAAAIAAAALISRALGLLDLDDSGARSLGARLAATRLVALVIAVLVSASIVGAVGAIGFIGLAGPAIARAAGARSLGERLVWGAAISAAILALTDQAVVMAARGAQLPTGSVTALFGAPLLLWLVWRLRSTAGGLTAAPKSRGGASWGGAPALLLLPALAAAVWLALSLGRVPDGWRWAFGPEFAVMAPWRAPRIAAALAAGFLLSVAGALLQRVSGNPMASPELLGVSSGAAIVVVIAAFVAPGLDPAATLALAAGGAFGALVLVLSFGRRSAFAPTQMLLIGVGLTALLNAASELLLVTGDPRGAQVLVWLAGSTYAVSWAQALFACAAAGVAALALPPVARWLAILPLGDPPAQALGVALRGSRFALLGFAATATAIATLLVGPLSFVGLMAPHLARAIGARGPLNETLTAGLLGAVIMVIADWLGRNVAFPWQIPAGVMATAVGGLYFAWAMRKDRA